MYLCDHFAVVLLQYFILNTDQNLLFFIDQSNSAYQTIIAVLIVAFTFLVITLTWQSFWSNYFMMLGFVHIALHCILLKRKQKQWLINKEWAHFWLLLPEGYSFQCRRAAAWPGTILCPERWQHHRAACGGEGAALLPSYLTSGSVSYWPRLINPSEWHWHNSA